MRRLSYLKNLEINTNNANIKNEIEMDRMRSHANKKLHQRLENRLLNRFGQNASLLLASSESETDVSFDDENFDDSSQVLSQQILASNNIETNLNLDSTHDTDPINPKLDAQSYHNAHNNAYLSDSVSSHDDILDDSGHVQVKIRSKKSKKIKNNRSKKKAKQFKMRSKLKSIKNKRI